MSVSLPHALSLLCVVWNKDCIVGRKRPLLPRYVLCILVCLELARNPRDIAVFGITVDSKLRGCNLLAKRIRDVYAAGCVKERASMIQSKTGKPVRLRSPRPCANPSRIGPETPI